MGVPEYTYVVKNPNAWQGIFNLWHVELEDLTIILVSPESDKGTRL